MVERFDSPQKRLRGSAREINLAVKFAEEKYIRVGAGSLGGVDRGPDFWANDTCGPSWS